MQNPTSTVAVATQKRERGTNGKVSQNFNRVRRHTKGLRSQIQDTDTDTDTSALFFRPLHSTVVSPCCRVPAGRRIRGSQGNKTKSRLPLRPDGGPRAGGESLESSHHREPTRSHEPTRRPLQLICARTAAVVIQTAARAFLARKEAAARAFLTRRAAARKAAAAEEIYFPDISVHDVAPPSPEYTLAELLDAAFPDIEDVFSVEELLELWSEFEAGEY